METTSTLLRVLAGIAVTGVVSTVVISACIYHDTDIKLSGPGHLWCGQAVGAQVWDVENEEVDVLIPNLDIPPTDDFPIGCECLSEYKAHPNLKTWVSNPPSSPSNEWDQYQALLQRVRDAVFEKCDDARQSHPYNQYAYDNCSGTAYGAAVFELANPTGKPNCTWTGKHPIYGYGGTGDTGSIPPPSLDPSREMTCTSQGHCEITPALAVAFRDEILEFANEQRGYGEFVSDGLQLKMVDADDVVYLLGFRTDDVIMTVNNYGLRNPTDVEGAMLALLDETEFQVSLKRQVSGSWSTLSYEYEIQ